MYQKYPETGFWTRPRVHLLSRAVIVALLVVSLFQYGWHPEGPIEWVADIGLRTYLMFLCTVMAHEGSHNQLAATRIANDWWGRIALVPVLVPYMNFRKTHRMHHAKTNVPGEDPDLFMKSGSAWQIPLRAIAMPHWWLVWLRRRGWLGRAELLDLGLNYVGFGLVYGIVVALVGWERFLLGVGPALLLVSVLLWYPFAVKTHEGFSQGAPATRSHNYRGHFAYWFSLGLSMHRVHHLVPSLAWIQMLGYVEPSTRGRGLWRRLFDRSMVREAA